MDQGLFLELFGGPFLEGWVPYPPPEFQETDFNPGFDELSFVSSEEDD